MTSARDAVRLFEAVDAGDVRMVQRRERLRFALEAREPIGVGANASGRTLRATSRSSSGRAPIDLAHAAGPKADDDLVRAEAGA